MTFNEVPNFVNDLSLYVDDQESKDLKVELLLYDDIVNPILLGKNHFSKLITSDGNFSSKQLGYDSTLSYLKQSGSGLSSKKHH